MATAKAAGGGGTILTRKTGPLPNWVYMALILLVALMFSTWRKNRSAVGPADVASPSGSALPGNQAPPPVFIMPTNPVPSVPINITVPTAPPGGGRVIIPDRPPSAQPQLVHVPALTRLDPFLKSHQLSYAKFGELNPKPGIVVISNRYGYVGPNNPLGRDPASEVWSFPYDADVRIA